MQTYLNILQNLLSNGQFRPDRTGTGTFQIFGAQWRHNLQAGFPLLTTKRVHIKSVLVELLWLLSGSTNIKGMQAQGVTIWDEWADGNGDLGPVYSKQYRDWLGIRSAAHDSKITVRRSRFENKAEGGQASHIDQIALLIEGLKRDPFSRRHIVTCWNPVDVPDQALPPCHMIYQCNVSETAGRRFLSLHLIMRSSDSFLGLPFNIASYAFLTHMLAHVCGYEPGELVISFGDLHLYSNHVTQAAEQLKREPRPLPTLRFARDVSSIDDFKLEDFIVENYNPAPAIKAPIAV
jgi:thymidylate synthase